MMPTVETSGGNRLGAKLRELQARLSKHGGVNVGVPKGSGTYEGGEQIVTIAAVHEFGSSDGRIPERSFLRVPLRGKQKEVNKIFLNQLPLVVRGELTLMQLLEQVGAKGAGWSQEAIEAGIAPPLAASTIRQREYGGTNPLSDTGALKGSITYWVPEE